MITETTIKNVLTRTSGYLASVCTHSLQPYRGCTFGNSLCGVGCYVQHNGHVLKGRKWGSFLEVRTNAAASYLQNVDRERRWAHRRDRRFSIFCSSSTDPFVLQERRFGTTRSVLEAMHADPPDELIIQTHTHHVCDALPVLERLQHRCNLRVHLSIETDRDRLPGLPPPAATVEQRLDACAALKDAGLPTVVTVAPLLPIDDPHSFFQRIAEVADAVVIDHYIEGDGSADGRRTMRTSLPDAMEQVDPQSTSLACRATIADIARQYLPGHVGISIDGFAGRYS